LRAGCIPQPDRPRAVPRHHGVSNRHGQTPAQPLAAASPGLRRRRVHKCCPSERGRSAADPCGIGVAAAAGRRKNSRQRLRRVLAQRGLPDRPERIRLDAARRQHPGRRAHPERARPGARDEPAQPIPEEPQVSVAEFRPFYIIGEIEKPGSYPYRAASTLIAIAGGTTYRASKSAILIQHPGEAGLRERGRRLGADPARRHHQGAATIFLERSPNPSARSGIS
jgi:hypothetical protein